MVKESKLGTAYGFITALQNGGLAVFPIIVGALTGKDEESTTQYFYCEVFFCMLGAFGTVVGIMLLCTDNKNGAKLAKPSIKKKGDGDCNVLGQRLLDGGNQKQDIELHHDLEKSEARVHSSNENADL